MDKIVSADKTCRDGKNLRGWSCPAQRGQGRQPARPLRLSPAPLVLCAATHRHDELLDAVGRHAVQVGEVQLQMDLVVEHVLAERAAQHGLHRVLGHGVHPQPVHVRVTVLAIWTLVHLQSKTNESHNCYSCCFPFSLQLDFNNSMPSPTTSYHLSSSFSYFILCFWHI